MQEFHALDRETARIYVEKAPFFSRFFQQGEQLISSDIADGNVNLVFRVSSKSDPKARSILVKQALPHARKYPDFKMPLERARLEFDVLTLEHKYCPELVPTPYHFDGSLFVNVMEDLNRHIIMRGGIMSQTVYESFGSHIGHFLAKTLFYTSDLFLSSAEKKALVPRFLNPVLTKVSEDLCLTFPYVPHPSNKFPDEIVSDVAALHGNLALCERVLGLKSRFMRDAEALIHGDLHTGSIMVNAQETKVIDPEFAFYGPIGYDIGNVIGNLIIGHVAQEFYAPDQKTRTTYRDWLNDTIRTTWNTFDREFRLLWDSEGQPEWKLQEYQDGYLSQLFEDTKGFAATEILRRTIGMAKVPELDEITDKKVLATVSRELIRIGTLLLTSRKLQTVDAVVTELGK